MKLPLGQVVWTDGINEEIADNELFAKDVLEGLRRHANCDWGDVDKADKEANDEAACDGDRVLSVYGKGPLKFWIITEWDRSVTTVLFPSEY